MRKARRIAATDYVGALPEMIRPYMPVAYHTLGTDGFGRSDTREALRDFFEVDRRWITVAAPSALYAREHLGLTQIVFDHVMPRTTVASAQKSASRTLSKAVSENLFRLSRLTVIAEEAFGSRSRAQHWLTEPNPVFDNEAPAELADTQAGAAWVEAVLMRMMYGVDA